MGYLEWWEDRSKTEGGDRSGKSGGHGRGSARANSVAMSYSFGGNATNNNTSPLLFMTEEWKALTGLMSTSKTPAERLNGTFQKVALDN